MSEKIVLDWIPISNFESIAHMDSCQINQKVYLKKSTNSDVANHSIFLFHDLCQYSGSYKNFVEWLLVHIPKITIYTLDYVGHGQSSGTRGHFDEFEILVKDQFQFIEKVDMDSEQIITFLGHGLGGLVTLEMYNKYGTSLTRKPNKLILSNFILQFDHLIFKFGLKNRHLLNQLTKNMKFLKVFDTDQLTHRSDMVLAFELDPLVVHRPTLSTILEVKSKAKSIYQDAYYLDIPIMIAWSEKNPYIFKPGMKYFIKGVKKDLLSEKTYSHMKHDLYNELDNIGFYNDIKNWIVSNEN